MKEESVTKSKLVCAIGVGLGLFAATLSTASADEATGWYFGVRGGQATVDISKEALDETVVFVFEEAGATVLSGSSSLDDSDTAWSLFGGYRVSRFFALEAGYQDLGAATYRSSGTIGIFGVPGTFPASANVDFESSGFTAAGVGTIPMGEKFDVHGRLGVLFADTEATLSVGVAGESGSESFSASSQGMFYGVGAALHLGKNWSISLDYLMFKDVGDEEETGEADVDSVTLGVSYRL
jgi:OmpA-OmpF porin, OOP family